MSEPKPLEDYPEDVREIAKRIRARKAHAPAVSLEEKDDGSYNLVIGASDEAVDTLRLMDAIGVCELDFLHPLLAQIGNATSLQGQMREDMLQFVVAFIRSIEPKSEMETMLASQMAAVHICALDASRRYLWADTVSGKDSAERAMNKLTRTFTTQMDALKKHRSKAQQTVRVERVNVENGGQAIVGDVSHGGRVRDE